MNERTKKVSTPPVKTKSQTPKLKLPCISQEESAECATAKAVSPEPTKNQNKIRIKKIKDAYPDKISIMDVIQALSPPVVANIASVATPGIFCFNIRTKMYLFS